MKIADLFAYVGKKVVFLRAKSKINYYEETRFQKVQHT